MKGVNSIRTWFTSLNQRLVDVTLAGSSRTQRGHRRFLTTLKMPLPAPPPKSGSSGLPSSTPGLSGGAETQATQRSSRNVGHKVAWGGVKVA